MTLREALENYPDERIVSLGASDGYFYIGEKQNFDAVATDKHYIAKIKELLRKNRVTQKGLKNNMPVRGENESMSDFAFRQKHWHNTLKQLTKTIQARREQLNTCIPLADRQVIDVYKRISEQGMAYIVEGNLHGE